MEDWWLDEMRFVGEEHLDARWVAGYDGKARFDPTPDIELLQRHGLDEGSTVIDLGAGTGTFAEAVARTGASVVAVDPSPVMVETIRSKTRGLPGVTVATAGLLSYQHEGDADYVYSRHVLHQLPEFWKVMALLRIGTMIKEGGILLLRDLVYDAQPVSVGEVLDDWMDSASREPASGYTRHDFISHVTSEFSTFSWLLEEALERTGFAVIDKSVRRSIYARYVCRFIGT